MTATNTSYASHYVEVDGAKIHYLEQGSGDPILFLHGMPTSSYLWRNILPYVAPLGRCIALDLIGMGKSDKPDIAYSIQDHIHFLERFIEVLGLKRIVMVVHDWGSVVGLDYAMRHEANMRGIVFYESYLRPINGDDLALPLYEQISDLQQQEKASELIANGTLFVDRVLPQGMMRPLTEEEMANYREPFLPLGAGKPLYMYMNELPRPQAKTAVDKIISQYSSKLEHSKLPKLLLISIPGFITTMATATWARDHLPNLEIVDIGEEYHYAQESNPALMGETISVWLQGIEQG